MSDHPLYGLRQEFNAVFEDGSDPPIVRHYGDTRKEYDALQSSVGLLDLSHRGRLCAVGEDRQRFLHGQLTNDINGLEPGHGCYTAITSNKGRMQSDAYVFHLKNEFLIDTEPGVMETVQKRLEDFIIADDVEVVDASSHYGLLTIQGPKSLEVVQDLFQIFGVPQQPLELCEVRHPDYGQLYLANLPRLGTTGYDLYAPNSSLNLLTRTLLRGAMGLNGTLCGSEAFDIARIEAGIPRYGVDMDDTNLPAEAGIDDRAVSYQKGCYIGQEVLNRLRTHGKPAKRLMGLWIDFAVNTPLPAHGDAVLDEDGNKTVGQIASAVHSFRFDRPIALAIVKQSHTPSGTPVLIANQTHRLRATTTPLPFHR